MATQKALEKDINFFVNEETPNYWKFMFFLIRNTLSTGKIILVAVIFALFQVSSYVPPFVQSTYQTYSQNKTNQIATERNEKLLTIKNFDVAATTTRIDQVYADLEKTKTAAEDHIKKINIRSGAKDDMLSDVNLRYTELIKQINANFENTYRGIALAKNPTNLNLDNYSKEQISKMLTDATFIQNNFYHGFTTYNDFMKKINYSLVQN